MYLVSSWVCLKSLLAFVNVAYLAKTCPDDCLDKLSRYYDEFQGIVNETAQKEEKVKTERSFTVIKGGK